jgi:MFS family permease
LAFFPIFTRAADNPLTWLDPGVVISLPLAGYLIAITFGSPLARPLAGRFGHRTLLLLAVLPTLVGHLGLYFSTNTVEIIGFRTLTGLGFGITTLACQDYVLDVIPPQERNRSLAQFTAAMFGGIFAGTALGGVLADRLGQDTVFAVSAVLVLVSGALTYRLLPRRPVDEAAASKPRGSYMPPIWRPLRSLRFSALVFGIALPANLVLQAFISFLVALQLNALGVSSSDIGRILMTYFIAVVFVGPAVPYLFESRLHPSLVSVVGSAVIGVSLAVVLAWPSQWAMLVAAAGAGVGSGMIRDSQVATAVEIAERELAHLGSDAVLGSLRTLERLGSMFGLVAIALLSSHVGYVNAIGIIAGIVLAGGAGFAVVLMGGPIAPPSRRPRGTRREETDPAS